MTRMGIEAWEAFCAEREIRFAKLSRAEPVALLPAPVPKLLEKPAVAKHNIPTDGYASKKEARRAIDLNLMELGGAIADLVEQPEFLLIPAQDGERPVKYRGDFAYIENGQRVVEDCKGFRTAEYIIKRKLMLFIHGIKVRET